MKLSEVLAVNTSKLAIGVYKGKEFIEEFENDKAKEMMYLDATVTDFHALNEDVIAVMIDITTEADRSENVYAFPTNEFEKNLTPLPKGTRLTYSFQKPMNGHYAGDEIIFVNEDYSDVLRLNLYKIEAISGDKKRFTFISLGSIVNVSDSKKLQLLLKRLKED